MTHIYLIPGLFGFARLAGHDYFMHLEAALHQRYRSQHGHVYVHVIPTPPTASLMTRATVAAEQVARTAKPGQPIHLVGHSTGGLDARLLLSPHTRLGLPATALAWRDQVRTLVTINCPHYGTPLAGYFTSAAGTRLLNALSLLTVTSLSIGNLPLTMLSGLVTSISTLDDRLGLELRVLDEITTYILRYVSPDGRAEITEYLHKVREDRGGIVQLMPEVMAVFNAAVGDSPRVRYGCIATAGPEPGPKHLAAAMLAPASALSRAIYTIVHRVTTTEDAAYPYATPTREQLEQLTADLGEAPDEDTVDGIVPTLSMLWGQLIYAGQADHLDIVGHFADDLRPQHHIDWLESGAPFSRAEFQRMVSAIVGFQNGEVRRNPTARPPALS